MAALLESPCHSALYRTAIQRDNGLLSGKASTQVARVLRATADRWLVLAEKAQRAETVLGDHFGTVPQLFSAERTFEMKVQIEMEREWMPLPYDFADDE